jgi:hypothetical protein
MRTASLCEVSHPEELRRRQSLRPSSAPCYTDNTVHPAIPSGFKTPQLPMFYDLSGDPHEGSNLSYTDLTCGWMLAPALKLIGCDSF